MSAFSKYPMRGTMLEGDFSAGTITFKVPPAAMYLSGGEYVIAPAAVFESGRKRELLAECMITLKEVNNNLGETSKLKAQVRNTLALCVSVFAAEGWAE
jgi:hypothetical protein